MKVFLQENGIVYLLLVLAVFNPSTNVLSTREEPATLRQKRFLQGERQICSQKLQLLRQILQPNRLYFDGHFSLQKAHGWESGKRLSNFSHRFFFWNFCFQVSFRLLYKYGQIFRDIFVPGVIDWCEMMETKNRYKIWKELFNFMAATASGFIHDCPYNVKIIRKTSEYCYASFVFREPSFETAPLELTVCFQFGQVGNTKCKFTQPPKRQSMSMTSTSQQFSQHLWKLAIKLFSMLFSEKKRVIKKWLWTLRFLQTFFCSQKKN